MAIPTYLPQQANIQAYYALEDVNDGSANGYNLTNYNSVSFAAAKIGNGADFGASNTNKYLEVANNIGIDGGAITIALWVKNLSEVAANQFVFIGQQNDNTDVYYGIWYEYNGGTRRLQFHRLKQNVAFQTVNYNVTMGTANWYHIVLTYNTTNIIGYVNGSSVGSAAASGNGSGTNSNMLRISDSIATAAASSLIDEVIVWNTALTVDEIAQVYRGFIPQIIIF